MEKLNFSKYQFKDKVKTEIFETIKVYSDLYPVMESYKFNLSNNQKCFVSLIGTIKVNYRNKLYNFPVSIYLTETYPLVPPIAYVKPTSTMELKPNAYVDIQGRISVSYLMEWKENKSNLQEFLSILQIKFSEAPPIFSKAQVVQRCEETGPMYLDAEMSHANLSSFHTILEDYNIEELANIPEKFKCLKCKKILKNPFQVPCGCQFCFQCLKDMINNGVERCFGNFQDCKDTNLSNYVPHYQLNKEISKLVVKCPEEKCLYKCALFFMPEHIRVCSMQSINCPLHNYGCSSQRLSKNEMNDHFLNEQYSHYEIILDLIGTVRNEVTELQQNDTVQKNELTVLKQELMGQEEKVELLSEQIKSIQKEKELLEEKLETIKNDLQNDINSKFNQKNQETVETEVEVGILKQEEKGSLFSNVTGKNKETEPQVVKYVIVKGLRLFYWTINEMSEKMKNCQRLNSGYFYDSIYQYKLQLAFYNFAQLFYFNLCVHASDNDHNLKWPFKAKVSLTVGVPADRKKGITVTKYCVIQRPVNIAPQFSESFKFTYVDCCNEGLFPGNICTVKCDLSIT